MTDELSDFAKLLAEPEELHPILQAHLYEGAGFQGGTLLQHPLVHEIFYTPHMNAMYNRNLEGKLRMIAEAKEKGDWHTYVFAHERPWRVEALEDIQADIEDYETYGKLVRSVWTDSENIWQNMELWEDILTGFEELTGWEMMETHERDKIRFDLPSVVTVYRGYTFTRDGWSWTLDAHKARWFAVRFAGLDGVPAAKVAKGKVPRDAIIAYLTSRGEEEIVVDPRNVHIKWERVVA